MYIYIYIHIYIYINSHLYHENRRQVDEESEYRRK